MVNILLTVMYKKNTYTTFILSLEIRLLQSWVSVRMFSVEQMSIEQHKVQSCHEKSLIFRNRGRYEHTFYIYKFTCAHNLPHDVCSKF